MTLQRLRPLLALGLILMSGCASIPDSGARADLDAIGQEATSGWSEVPAVTYRSHRQALRLVGPGRLPAEAYDQLIELDLNGRVTVDDLVLVLHAAGIPVMLANQELQGEQIFVPYYRGRIGPLLDSMAAITNLSFDWHRGVLLIDRASQYVIRIPQNDELTEKLSSAIGQMGATEVAASKEAGIVSYRATFRQQKTIETYLDRLATNTAVVNLQMAVINVMLEEQRRTGFDWGALAAQLGEVGLAAQSISEGATAIAGGAEELARPSGSLATLTGQGLRLQAAGGDLNLNAVLNLLSTYGQSQTMQNLTLKTLSGVPVSMRSGQTIPYVSGVNVAVTSHNNALGGVETDNVETGFDITLEPVYDAEERLITVGLEMSLSSLIGFRELSAGEQVGTLSQPEIQDQALESIVRLDAGETVLLGGLIYDAVSDNRTSLAGLERFRVGSKALRTDRTAMFILIRPTVTLYGPLVTESRES